MPAAIELTLEQRGRRALAIEWECEDFGVLPEIDSATEDDRPSIGGDRRGTVNELAVRQLFDFTTSVRRDPVEVIIAVDAPAKNDVLAVRGPDWENRIGFVRQPKTPTRPGVVDPQRLLRPLAGTALTDRDQPQTPRAGS